MNARPLGNLVLGTAPAAEPVGTDELKTHLHVSGTGSDAYVTAIGKAARELAEAYTNRAFITQTWDLYFDCFPDGTEIPLAKPPLQSVAFVKYIDAAGTEQTWGTANYFVDDKRQPPRIVKDSAVSWPDTDDRPNAVHVQFVAGYGTAGTMVPESLRHGIKLIAANLMEHRGDRQESGVLNSEPRSLPPAAEHLMFPYRAF